MNPGNDSLLNALHEGLVLGPEHRRFCLLHPIGETPFGPLWQAEDLLVKGKPTATLLFPHGHLLNNRRFSEALKTHATKSKQLKNKHLLEGYGYFIQPGGGMFLAYEQLQGLTLQQLLNQQRKLKTEQRNAILKQLAYAIDSGYQLLHQPHLLLSPEMVYLNPGQGVILAGFALTGAADELEDTAVCQRLQAYLPPETEQPQPLGRQADVFSYACITYRLLSGKEAFTAETPFSERGSRDLPAIKTLNSNQWQALQQALSDDPQQRPASCSALARTLFTEEESTAENIADSIQATAPAETGTQAPTKQAFAWRKPGKPLLYSAAGGGLFLLGIWVGWGISAWINHDLIERQRSELAGQAVLLEELQQTLTEEQQARVNLQTQLAQQKTTIETLQAQLLVNQQTQADRTEHPATQIFRDQIDGQLYGPEMILLPAGSFMMGDGSGEGDDNELPRHEVSISQPFALSRFEVTFAEYDRFAKATGRKLPDDQGWGRELQPVINISWRDAVAYTRWLGDMTGQPYRLPSEAEWEYAARAGSSTPYWWGNELKPNMAVCDNCGSPWDGKQPAQVGSFPANPWGLHDMTGNVDEWVADCYSDSYSNTPVDGRAFLSSGCEQRVMRGGSWFEIARLIRPASRYRHPANSRRNSWGFRVALDLPQQPKDKKDNTHE